MKRFFNRFQKRYPRAIGGQVRLAKLDFNFVVAVDRIETQEGHTTPASALVIAREAQLVLTRCNIPQSEWEVPYAAN